uniref:hypothetical protein n=1 Tax=Nonomuraea sp. CA-251285 TaxID=3240002 RepID=UPI003F49920D
MPDQRPRGGLSARLVSRLPVWVRQQPIDAMFALLGIPSGLAALTGLATSRALMAVLPDWAAVLWGLCLVAGCACYLSGLMSMRERDGRLVITRLGVLMLGLQIISPAALVYGVAIIVASGWAGLLAAWPLIVAAAATWIRRTELR